MNNRELFSCARKVRDFPIGTRFYDVFNEECIIIEKQENTMIVEKRNNHWYVFDNYITKAIINE